MPLATLLSPMAEKLGKRAALTDLDLDALSSLPHRISEVGRDPSRRHRRCGASAHSTWIHHPPLPRLYPGRNQVGVRDRAQLTKGRARLARLDGGSRQKLQFSVRVPNGEGRSRAAGSRGSLNGSYADFFPESGHVRFQLPKPWISLSEASQRRRATVSSSAAGGIRAGAGYPRVSPSASGP